MRQLFSVKETAEYLSVNQFSLYRWLRQGVLPYIKIGGRVRIDRDDIENYIKKHKVNVNA